MVENYFKHPLIGQSQYFFTQMAGRGKKEAGSRESEVPPCAASTEAVLCFASSTEAEPLICEE